MNWRFTLIVVLVFAALLAFMVTQLDAPPQQVGKGAPTATPEALLTLDAKDVQELYVEADEGSYSLDRVAGGWQVDGEDASDEVDGVAERMAELGVIRDLPADRDPDDYGFAAPPMTVTLRMASGDEHVLQIGDNTPVDYNVYARLLDDTRVVIVSRGDIERLRDWLSTPPYAPTPTPEEPPTAAILDDADEEDASDVEDGVEADGTAEADDPSSGDDVDGKVDGDTTGDSDPVDGAEGVDGEAGDDSGTDEPASGDDAGEGSDG